MGCSTLYRVRLVYHETSRQKDAFVSTAPLPIFLALKIAVFYSLVISNVYKYFSSLHTMLQFASVRRPRSFWIPSPSLGSMATARLV